VVLAVPHGSGCDMTAKLIKVDRVRSIAEAVAFEGAAFEVLRALRRSWPDRPAGRAPVVGNAENG
jgi:hypothetical protein